jgi:hypothetical protein
MFFYADITESGCVLRSRVLGLLQWTISEQCCQSIVIFCLQIVGQLRDDDNKKVHYEQLTSNLLECNRVKMSELENHNFPNSLEGIQKELLHFKQYRTMEKPLK